MRGTVQSAGLVWVTDTMSGIRRLRRGKGFVYARPDGRAVREPSELARIRALAIPPAWTDVWICPLPHGHIQAIGRDARGRRQYRYHARFREERDAHKYGQLLEFGRLLPAVRRRLRRDLARAALEREKVLATVVRLLEETLIRVGNDEYARANHSFGLTTLRDRHVSVKGASIRFQFRGKSGKLHQIEIADPRLARIVKSCQDLPGQELFQWVDAQGRVHDVGSSDINEYLRAITGRSFTAKDFRTWAGTVFAARILAACEPCPSQSASRRAVAECMRQVAERLGNTAAICRKSYVHPAVVDAFDCGELAKLAARALSPGGRTRALEAFVLQLLRRTYR